MDGEIGIQHASVYAGVPAAVDSFRIANEVLSELGLTEKPTAAPPEPGAA